MKNSSWLILATTFLAKPLVAAAADLADATGEPGMEAQVSSPDERLHELQQITVTGRKPLIDNKNVTLGALGNKDVMEIEPYFVEEEDAQVDPAGVKGMGEIGICGVAAAIANAVFNATGKRIRTLPITPDKLI